MPSPIPRSSTQSQSACLFSSSSELRLTDTGVLCDDQTFNRFSKRAARVMRLAVFPLVFAFFSGAGHSAFAQLSGPGRPAAAYHSDHPLDPATLMSQEHFSDTAQRGYVVVEGYIDYVA